MTGFLLNNGRLFLHTDIHTLGASCVERTALGRIHGAGNIAFKNGLCGVLLIDFKSGNGGKQRFRIGVKLVFEQLVTVGNFAYATQIHNKNTVAEMLYNAKIVGDEEVCKLFFL